VVLLLLLAVLWAAAGAPSNWLDGLSWLLAGLWAVAYPARRRLSRIELGLCVLWMLLSLSSFLPEMGSQSVAWRAGLGNAGIDVGTRITPEPVAAIWSWTGYLLRGFLFMRILAEGAGERSRRKGLVVFSLLALAYLGLSWIKKSAGGFAAGGVEVFGFFPNRNHTATLLAMGSAAGMGLLLEGLRRKTSRLIVLGLASLALPACGLIFLSVSRAGIALLAAGLLSVVILSGRRARRGRSLRVILLLGVGVCMLLALAPSESRDRLITTAQVATGDVGVDHAGQLDGRIGIHRDAMDMILDHPLAGWGAGQFEHVFPQYRRLSAPVNDAAATHPESSWLWVAAEFGLPAAGCLLLLLVSQIIPAARTLKGGADRRIRSGCLVAGCIPFVHSLVDVPLHCDSLLWLGGYLLSQTRDEEFLHCGRRSVWLWRLGAAGVAACGAMLLSTAHRGLAFRPSDAADAAVADAREFYLRSRKELEEGSSEDSRQSGVRHLDQALEGLDQAIRLSPLDSRLHGLRGMINLNFDDRDSLSRMDFLRQRLLDPSWIRLRMIQADSWKPIDPSECLPLWQEALDLAKYHDQLSGGGTEKEERTFRSVVIAATGEQDLEKQCVTLASGHLHRLVVLCKTLRKDRLKGILPELVAELKRTPGAERLLEPLRPELEAPARNR
jgi:O-antigen ligase